MLKRISKIIASFLIGLGIFAASATTTSAAQVEVHPVEASLHMAKTGNRASFDMYWGGGDGLYYYYLDFGDGSEPYDPAGNNPVRGKGDTVRHTYSSGTYTAILNVRSGSTSDTDSVIVRN